MTDDLYATYEVFREVVRGKPFREAYQNVAGQLSSGTFRRDDLATDFDAILTTVRLELEMCRGELANSSQVLATQSTRFCNAVASVFDQGS
jgi:hypothetical protein